MHSASGEYPEAGLRPFWTPGEEIGLEIITRGLYPFYLGWGTGIKEGL